MKPLTMSEDSLVDLRNRSFCGAPYLTREARQVITEVDACHAEIERLREELNLAELQAVGLVAEASRLNAERDRLAAELTDARNDSLEIIDGHAFVCTVCGEPREGHVPKTMVECAEGAVRGFTQQRAQLIAAQRERDRLAAQLLQDAPLAAEARAFGKAWDVDKDLDVPEVFALLDLARAQREGG